MFRFAIKDLLFLTAFVAVGAAALRYGGDLWSLTLSSCLLFSTMIAAVVMVADRGRRQAIASGFANAFQFPEIAHLLWSLLFGYLGARLAGLIYSRRIVEEARAPRSS